MIHLKHSLSMQIPHRVKLEPLGCETASHCETPPGLSHSLGPATKLAKIEPSLERGSDQDWEGGWGCSVQEIDQGFSFVPVEPSDPDPGSARQIIPNRRIAVSDILPLTLSSGQVGF